MAVSSRRPKKKKAPMTREELLSLYREYHRDLAALEKDIQSLRRDMQTLIDKVKTRKILEDIVSLP